MSIFKHMGIVLLVLTLFIVLLAGCRETPDVPPEQTPVVTEAPVDPTAAPEATAAPTEAPTETPEVEPIDMMDTLNLLTGWGQGTAGSSLQSVSCAHSLVTWADENQAAQLDEAALQAGILEWVETLPEDLVGSIKATWLWVESTGNQLLDKDPNLELILGDVNKEYIDSETAAEHWAALCKAIDTVMEPIQEEIIDP